MSNRKLIRKKIDKVVSAFSKAPVPVRVVLNPDRVRLKCTKVDGEVLTKGEFADWIGISENSYGDISNDNTVQIRKETIAAIISATGCRLDDIFEIVPL